MKEVKDIWQFFENMNEYVYATDIETHEIVYMNRKTLQVYGLQSLEDAKGKKCYEIDRKSTRLNSSHYQQSRMPSSA